MKYISNIIKGKKSVHDLTLLVSSPEFRLMASDSMDESYYEEYTGSGCVGYVKPGRDFGYACVHDLKKVRFCECIESVRTDENFDMLAWRNRNYIVDGNTVFVNTHDEVVTVQSGFIVVKYIKTYSGNIVCTCYDLFKDYCMQCGINLMKYQSVQFINGGTDPTYSVFQFKHDAKSDAFLTKMYTLDCL